VEEFCFLGGWQEADQAGFARAIEDTRQLCRLATALGCDLLIAVPAAAAGTLDAAPQRFRKLCDVAAEYAVRIALEFPGTAAEVKDVQTAWRLISAAGRDNGGLVVDTFHFVLGNSSLEDLAAVPREKIFLVHVSDAMDVSPEKLRSFHDYRTFPGLGTLDYAPLFRELNRLGYEGAISLEVWNQEMLRADPEEIARQGFEALLGLSRLLPAREEKQRGQAAAEEILRPS
jgi:4-hydroxyphenylpyruvate dioxygenase